MASTLKCPSCGSILLSNEKNCPQCGRENAGYVEDTPRRIFHPKTIQELKEYCAERGMPLLRMRFFVGQDHREPKAFGIYKADGNRYVVYKNKADGSRAVRYDGPDEAYAVNELFEKLLSECHNRGIYPDGAVARVSGSTVPRVSSGRSKKPILLIVFGIIILSLVLFGLYRHLSHRQIEKAGINQKVDALRRQPDTYDSVSIAGRYYTFSLEKQDVVSSFAENAHVNDGYYQESFCVYPLESGIYAASETVGSSGEDVQDRAVYYRDGYRTWYVYIASEHDWRPAEEPAYDRLGISLDYLGNTWQPSWNVPDYSSFPVTAGYYSHEGSFYYRYRDTRERSESWYVFSKADADWVGSCCPVKLGIAAESLKYLGTDDHDLKTGVKSFKGSTPYAVLHQLEGYYRQDGQVYYEYKKSKSVSPLYYWYTYGQVPTSYIYAEETPGDWYKTSEPDKDSLVYMGDAYDPDWQEQWPVADFKQSAVGLQAYQINGYVKQEQDLFYHYKETWYLYDTDRNDWIKASEPAGDGLSEIFLGDSYHGSSQAGIADEWQDDWNATDFKTSDAWYSIERAEAERIAWEKEADERREKERRESRSSSYISDHDSSDYDSWDSDDTDWDSDW